MPAAKTVRTMCPMNCHPTLCGMQVKVADGNLLKVEGDPENPDSRGFLCVRGRAAGQIIGNDNRLLYPQIRTRRGSDDWQRISWAQAIDTIADKLASIEPEQFGIWQGHGDAATNYGTRIGGLLARRFARLYGGQWWHPAMICWGLGGFGLGITGTLEVHTKEDMSANAELILLWGANLDSQPNTAPHLKTAKKRGARVVAIDVRETAATAQADDVFIIKPGTDGALALAMMQIIVAQGAHDSDFIRRHTVGFEQLKTRLEQYTSDWAQQMTGLSARRIEQLALNYATVKPAMIVLGGSSMHKSANGWMGARTIACLPGLTGNAGQPGGGFGPRHGSPSHGQGLNDLLSPTGNNCRRVIPNQMSAMTRAMQDGEISALLLTGTNMLSSFADSGSLRRALSRIDLVVCHDLFASDTIRECADIVLPATAWLEQLGCKMTHTHLYLMDQALEPPAETATLSKLLQDLASKLDLAEFFPWQSDEQMIDAIIDHPSTGHASVARLREEQGMRALHISHHANPEHKYSTPSGKIEFYSQRAADLGLPALPEYVEASIPSRYPLQFRQGRTLTHFHSFYDHGRALPALARLESEPTLWISPGDAAARDIETGQSIRIFNQRGTFAAQALVTPKIGDGAVWMHDGWAGINSLTSGAACLPDVAVDTFPFSAGQAEFDAFVEVAPGTTNT